MTQVESRYSSIAVERRRRRRRNKRNNRAGGRRKRRLSKLDRHHRILADSEIFVNGYDDTTDYRTDLCNLSTSITDGEINYDSALNGQTLKFIGYYKESDPYALDYSDDDGYSGWHYEVLDAIADLAGFDYELKLLNSSFPSNRTYFEKITYNFDHYDASIHSTTYTSDRASEGMLQPFSYIDESAWLVTKTRSSGNKNAFKNRNTFFRFAEPFSYKLWILTVSTTIVTGIIYFFIEHSQAYTDAETLQDAIHLSLLQVTQAGGFAPVTYGGKLLVLSWGMVVLIIISSYTANLAAFLVADNGSNSEYDSIYDVIGAGATVCVHTGYATQDLLDENYPEIMQYDTTDEYGNFYHGKCSALVTERAQYDVAKESSDIYPSCNFERVGDALDSTGGGWAIKGDYSAKCSSLLSQLLTQYFLQLDLDGTLSDLYDDYLDSWTDKSCDSSSDTSDNDDGSDEDALGIKEMTGVFVIHALTTLFALFIHFGFGWERKLWFHPAKPPDHIRRNKKKVATFSIDNFDEQTTAQTNTASKLNNQEEQQDTFPQVNADSSTSDLASDILTTQVKKNERPAPYLSRSKEGAHIMHDLFTIDRHVWEMQQRLGLLDNKFDTFLQYYGIFPENQNGTEDVLDVMVDDDDESHADYSDHDDDSYLATKIKDHRRSSAASVLASILTRREKKGKKEEKQHQEINNTIQPTIHSTFTEAERQSSARWIADDTEKGIELGSFV
eukprot:CAMPEP_0197309294 /NCGR_PEP_ID=MMETSP0891-20130614/7866_1 /TAXON_ID=44058 ORGANISM="Aureoumbra lagunensis, Strain CCMP1510" /NCGR_SAMPLE_ID=MMETSP0891 /ASSEMBLY_ACC=CAM_ASM_000534 /LENGTH=726 /DNA_ID=CAMNT_0042794279 /DNA_START=44 /DNA_END=2224 /DNA_ORIENTATION=+